MDLQGNRLGKDLLLDQSNSNYSWPKEDCERKCFSASPWDSTRGTVRLALLGLYMHNGGGFGCGWEYN
jgi:hypothetical protein